MRSTFLLSHLPLFAPLRSATDKEDGTPIWDPAFDLSSKASQVFHARLCQIVMNHTYTEKVMQSCFFSRFADYAGTPNPSFLSATFVHTAVLQSHSLSLISLIQWVWEQGFQLSQMSFHVYYSSFWKLFQIITTTT